MAETRITIKQLCTDLEIKDLFTMLNKYEGEKSVPAVCSEGCFTEKSGECRHKNPSIFVISGRVSQDLKR